MARSTPPPDPPIPLGIHALGTLDDDASSLQQLAAVVLREYGMAMTILRTANSAQYRRGGRPTESATQAMMVLGARVVRQPAGSMVLFEYLRRRSPELKELIVGSLRTGGAVTRAAVARFELLPLDPARSFPRLIDMKLKTAITPVRAS